MKKNSFENKKQIFIQKTDFENIVIQKTVLLFSRKQF